MKTRIFIKPFYCRECSQMIKLSEKFKWVAGNKYHNHCLVVKYTRKMEILKNKIEELKQI